MATTTKPKARGKGEGSLMLRRDGRWMARFFITLPNGERKRQHIICELSNFFYELIKNHAIFFDWLKIM